MNLLISTEYLSKSSCPQNHVTSESIIHFACRLAMVRQMEAMKHQEYSATIYLSSDISSFENCPIFVQPCWMIYKKLGFHT